jgi:hypothetical protein
VPRREKRAKEVPKRRTRSGDIVFRVFALFSPTTQPELGHVRFAANFAHQYLENGRCEWRAVFSISKLW